MNYLLKCLFLSCLLISVVACTDGINETVIRLSQGTLLRAEVQGTEGGQDDGGLHD